MNRDIAAIKKLDRELVSIVSDFQFLTPLSWGKAAQRRFLSDAAAGRLRLPEIGYPPVNHGDKIRALEEFIGKAGEGSHPAIAFLKETAQSYLYAYYILQGAGTPAVNEYSRRLYGAPSDLLPGYKRRNLDIARYFLRVVKDYQSSVSDEPMVYDTRGFRHALRKLVRKEIDPSMDPIAVTIDSQITARMTAGPNYVKIRKGAHFSEADLLQLLHHEVMTHTLTFINGRKQPVLTCLGYASPRTTATQEGLAVFAEYINLSIELVRLRRIALRIVAIDMAENGADLIDLFRFFRKHGQNEEESYHSAMRIFRGGTPRGGIVFYKDNVYLRGLIEVEGFLKSAMHRGMVHDIAILFAGKLAIGDVADLHTLIEKGVIAEPVYVPAWARKSGELAAHLAFNDLTERFKAKESREKTA